MDSVKEKVYQQLFEDCKETTNLDALSAGKVSVMGKTLRELELEKMVLELEKVILQNKIEAFQLSKMLENSIFTKRKMREKIKIIIANSEL